MTDQRERVSTDPGIGPIDADNTATLRSIEAAVEVEPDGAALYYEPKPLVAISDHRTLEMETVKLSQDIDPRRLPTELSLPRSPIPPRYDSGWPQAEVVLTTSQRPAPPTRRWRVPALLLGVLVALLLLVLARSSAQRSAEQSAGSALHAEAVALPAPVKALAALPTATATTSAALPTASAVASAAAPSSATVPASSTAAPSSATAPASSTAAPSSATVPASSTAAPSSATAELAASSAKHASLPVVFAPRPTALKASPQPSTSSAVLPPTAKPKRAIY